MRQLAPDLWVAEAPQSFGGFELGARMSVIRLRDGSLFLHSPVGLSARLRGELEALGQPRYAVSPNLLHHLYAGEYTRAYPELELHVAPGLEKKRQDLRCAGILADEAPPGWAGQIDQALFRGYPILNEIAFLHRASRTLLLADLAFNIRDDSSFATRLAFRLVGGYGRLGPSALERWLVRDQAAARRALERVLSWDFERVIVAHGRVQESGGQEALRRGYAWLLS
jgi:hypothetical protein